MEKNQIDDLKDLNKSDTDGLKENNTADYINPVNKKNQENANNNFFDNGLIRKIDMAKDKNMMYSPAQLAYAGDAVFELLVRSYIISSKDVNVNKMHKSAVKFVKANAQANFVKQLMDVLTEEEIRIVKRGRNAKVTSSPKNADLTEYRYATGFEALFGFLYLNNQFDRLMELFNKIVYIANDGL